MRAIVSWSGGKDCAWALHKIRQQGIEPEALLWVSDGRGDRYYVPPEIIEMQGRALGLPMIAVRAMQGPPRQAAIIDAYKAAVARGIDSIIGGHIRPRNMKLLEDRATACGIKLVTPHLGRRSEDLAKEQIVGGMDVRIMTVDLRILPPTMVGRKFDHSFVADAIKLGVDPCGEDGTFNTIAVGGLPFPEPLRIKTEVLTNPVTHLKVKAT
jgi:diphthamide synthase (EF-2-diphthine--ammonia ligase)